MGDMILNQLESRTSGEESSRLVSVIDKKTGLTQFFVEKTVTQYFDGDQYQEAKELYDHLGRSGRTRIKLNNL